MLTRKVHQLWDAAGTITQRKRRVVFPGIGHPSNPRGLELQDTRLSHVNRKSGRGKVMEGQASAGTTGNRGALSGVRVLELSQMVAGPFCAKILGDLGADVTKVEPPDGDRSRRVGPFLGDTPHPEKSALFLFCNTSKRGVTLDLEIRADKRAFMGLVGTSDILVLDCQPRDRKRLGLEYERLREVNPKLIVTSITPFGLTGPYRNYRTYHLNRYHAGGDGYLITAGKKYLDRPPIQGPCFLADYETGLGASVATLGALYHRNSTGLGQEIDCSEQEWCLNLNAIYVGKYPNDGFEVCRAKLDYPVAGIMECRDGYVMLIIIEDHHWKRLIKLMGDPTWALEERFQTQVLRSKHKGEVNAKISEFLMQHTKEELRSLARDIGIPLVPVASPAEVIASDQARARGFFGEVDRPQSGRTLYPLAIARFSRTPCVPERSPLLGEHNHALKRSAVLARAGDAAPQAVGRGTRCLEGVRITDFSWAMAGPYATMLLSFLGAQVIKIESRKRLDVVRVLTGALGWGDQDNVEKSVEFNLINLNKLGITLDLAHPEGVALAKRLVAMSDVVVENFSPGVMDNLGLGYDALRQIRPDIIMASVSSAGATGPERRSLGYAAIFHAAGGLAHLTGYPDSPPGYIRAPIDCNVACGAALAIMAALVHRQATGQGQYVDLSAREVVSYLIGHAFLDLAGNGKNPGRLGNIDAIMAPHDCYPCRGDDRWVSIAVDTEEEWQALVRTMGSPPWTREDAFADRSQRLKRTEELQRRIGEWTRQCDPYEITDMLQRAGVAAFPSLRPRDIYGDAHLKSRGWAVDVEHPVLGHQVVMGPPWKMSGTPPSVHSPAPTLGQHQDYVCQDVLGLSHADIEGLKARGAFG